MIFYLDKAHSRSSIEHSPSASRDPLQTTSIPPTQLGKRKRGIVESSSSSNEFPEVIDNQSSTRVKESQRQIPVSTILPHLTAFGRKLDSELNFIPLNEEPTHPSSPTGPVTSAPTSPSVTTRGSSDILSPTRLKLKIPVGDTNSIFPENIPLPSPTPSEVTSSLTSSSHESHLNPLNPKAPAKSPSALSSLNPSKTKDTKHDTRILSSTASSLPVDSEAHSESSSSKNFDSSPVRGIIDTSKTASPLSDVLDKQSEKTIPSPLTPKLGPLVIGNVINQAPVLPILSPTETTSDNFNYASPTQNSNALHQPENRLPGNSNESITIIIITTKICFPFLDVSAWAHPQWPHPSGYLHPIEIPIYPLEYDIQCKSFNESDWMIGYVVYK